MPEFGSKISELGQTTETPPRSDVLTIAQVIAAMATEGDPVATGFSPIDTRLRRGGLTPGRLICVGGPPFAGKTTIIVDMAMTMSQHVPVFALFQDEGRTQAAVRMGVMLGVPLDEIELSPAKAAPIIEDRTGERSLFLIDPESDLGNVEALFDYVASQVPKSETAVVILDSIQTIPPRPDADMSRERECIKDFMRISRGRAASDRRIVITSSQSNRESYKRRKAEENSVGISNFSGSASIEFLFDLGLSLSLPDEDSEIVRVEVVKNRLGQFRNRSPRVFHIRYDVDLGRMREVDQAEQDSANASAAVARLRPHKEKALELVRKAGTSGLSGAKLVELSGMRRNDAFAALKSLVEDRKIYAETKGRNVSYILDPGLES